MSPQRDIKGRFRKNYMKIPATKIELKGKNLQTAIKVAAACAIAFFVSPYIAKVVGGLFGMAAAFGCAFVLVQFSGYFARVVANWRMKAIKAEAAKNPVETMQNDYVRRCASVDRLETSIVTLKAKCKSLRRMMDDFENKYKDEKATADLEQQCNTMEQLIQVRTDKLKVYRSDLAMYEFQIGKWDALWQMALACSDAKEAAGILEGEGQQKIEIQTAIRSIQEKLDIGMADIDMMLIDEQSHPTVIELPKIADAKAVELNIPERTRSAS